ncbi:hypothetical protein Tco_1285363 [Tanacetum coccineum]
MGRDTIQLEDAVSTISQEYLLEFTSEYGIPESLHPELPGLEEPIVEFPEGKVGVYTKFFEFANFRIPISQFLLDILGHYQIHLSQLSVIGAAKVSHFEIKCRVLNIIPTLNLFRVFYVPSYNSGWMSFSKRPGKNTPQCYTKPLDSLKNWNNRFFWVDERIFPTVVEWRTNAPKDGMPSADSYSAADVTALNTHRTPIQKQPEALLCLVGLSRSYFLGDDVYPTFLYDDDRDMDLFNLISAPNPTKVKTGTRPRAAHEVPLLTATASRVIDMEDTTVASGSSGTPSALEKSPLDFANENPPPLITERDGMEDQVQDGLSREILPVENPTTTKVVLEPDLEKEVAAMGPLVNKRRRKRGNDEADANAPPKVLRKDHVAFRPAQSTLGGKSLASMGLEAVPPSSHLLHKRLLTERKRERSKSSILSLMRTTTVPERDVAHHTNKSHVPHNVNAGLSGKRPPEIPTENVATNEPNEGVKARYICERDPESGKSASFPSVDGSPGGIYQPEWGVTNNCRLDTPDACQDMVDHIVPPGYFSELRHLPNTDFLSQYNINLARQVAMGSQLRLRFKQEVKLLKKAIAKIARHDQRIQAREEEIKKLDQEIKSLRVVEAEVHGLHNQTKNLEALLEAEVDMKKAAEAKNAELTKELESLRVQFSDLQVSNNQLSQQVSNLQAQVTGEEKIKAAFEEFKKYEDDKVEQRCAEMDARLDKLSVDFDEELYPHMLTAIAGRRWVIGHGLRLAVMKCSESPELRQAFADVVSAGLVKGMSEGLKHGIDHGKAGRDLAAVDAYDPEADNKYVKALQDLKDLKYPLVDQLEGLKDAPMELIMASLYLESDSGEDAPQWIRDLRPSSSQLKIPVYPEVRDPRDPWAFKEDMLLEDAIATNISRAEM